MEMTSKKSWPVPGRRFLEHSKTLQMRRRELDRYLIEQVDQKTWIEGVRFMLADPDTPQRPWPCLPGRTLGLGVGRLTKRPMPAGRSEL